MCMKSDPMSGSGTRNSSLKRSRCAVHFNRRSRRPRNRGHFRLTIKNPENKNRRDLSVPSLMRKNPQASRTNLPRALEGRSPLETQAVQRKDTRTYRLRSARSAERPLRASVLMGRFAPRGTSSIGQSPGDGQRSAVRWRSTHVSMYSGWRCGRRTFRSSMAHKRLDGG